MALTPTPRPPATAVEHGTATCFSALHTDILETHILTRLDGQTLASFSSASATLRNLSDQDHLWSRICHSTWPSTTAERVGKIISDHHSFFSNSFPLPVPDPTSPSSSSSSSSRKQLPPPPSKLISAVDLYYKSNLIFSKVEETETVSGWFRCSPFRIDCLDPKDVVPTQIQHPDGDDTCAALGDDMTLSWILVDSVSGRSANLSSLKPVSVQRHWLTGEVQVRFASVLGGDWSRWSSATRLVECRIVVNCGGSEGGEMQVREVSMEAEDMDGKHLNGKDSLVILQRAVEGKRGSGVEREEEAKRRYIRFLRLKRERRERKMKMEGTLDTLSVGLGLSIFAAFWFFLFY